MDIKECIVAKKNELIEGISDLELLDFNLINMVISKIDSVNHDDLQTYIFTKKELVDFLKLGKNYKKLETLVKTIPYKKIIVNTINDDNESQTMTCYWFHSTIKKSTIEFRIDPRLKPYLIKLSGNFTTYELQLTRKFKSKYAFKFFELFLMSHGKEKKYKNIIQVKMDIDTIKEQLFLSKSYSTNFHLLRKRVIEPSIDDINKYTDLEVRFLQIKTGTKITEVDFFIKTKNNKNQESNNSQNGISNDFNSKKSAKEIFEKLWKLYPLQTNKGKIKIDDMIRLQEFGYDIIKRCIDRYLGYIKAKSEEGFEQNLQSGHNFFTIGYIDYLSEDYIPYKAKPKKNQKPIQSTNYEQRKYDEEFIESLYDNF